MVFISGKDNFARFIIRCKNLCVVTSLRSGFFLTPSRAYHTFQSDPFAFNFKSTNCISNLLFYFWFGLYIISRLITYMVDDTVSLELKVESAVVLGSIAKGTEENIRSLIDAGCVSVLLKGMWSKQFRKSNFNIAPLAALGCPSRTKFYTSSFCFVTKLTIGLDNSRKNIHNLPEVWKLKIFSPVIQAKDKLCRKAGVWTENPMRYGIDRWNDNDKAYRHTSCNIGWTRPLLQIAIEEDSHNFFFIADRQTKVVKLVTEFTRYYTKCGYMLYHSYFTKSIPLPIWIQITIHPLSTDGAIVILVFLF